MDWPNKLTVEESLMLSILKREKVKSIFFRIFKKKQSDIGGNAGEIQELKMNLT